MFVKQNENLESDQESIVGYFLVYSANLLSTAGHRKMVRAEEANVLSTIDASVQDTLKQ